MISGRKETPAAIAIELYFFNKTHVLFLILIKHNALHLSLVKKKK